MIKKSVMLVIAAGVLLAGKTSIAETKKVYASDDAMVAGDNANQNLTLGERKCMYLRHSNDTWGNNFSLVKFDLSSLPTNAIIKSAQMQIYASVLIWPADGGAFVPVGIYRNLGSWDQASVTYANVPGRETTAVQTVDHFGVPGKEVYFTGANKLKDTDAGWLCFAGNELAALVQGWVSKPTSNFGVTVAAVGYLPDGRLFSLQTSESNTSVQPRLILEYDEN